MNAKRIAELFEQGHAPDPLQLLNPDGGIGEWRVDMLTGPIPSMGGWPLHHRKRFVPLTQRMIIGCNVILKDRCWGHFDLVPSIFDTLLLDYNVPGNGWMRHIRDQLRTAPNPNVLIGRFYWRNHPRAWFTLTRLEVRHVDSGGASQSARAQIAKAVPGTER